MKIRVKLNDWIKFIRQAKKELIVKDSPFPNVCLVKIDAYALTLFNHHSLGNRLDISVHNQSYPFPEAFEDTFFIDLNYLFKVFCSPGLWTKTDKKWYLELEFSDCGETCDNEENQQIEFKRLMNDYDWFF